jgi:hypothetical protein
MGSRLPMALVAALLLSTAGANPAWSATSLLVSQGIAFSVLGHSCGGIQEHAFATGFDLTSGYPVGDVYLQTRCGGSGRGGGYHVTTYAAWIGVTWDYTGAVISYATLPSAPTVDPGFSAFDQYGNEVYNQSNSAFLVLSASFVPAPRVIAISPTIGPASGGTAVTITGTGFTAATGVGFGATAAASFTVNGDTSISAVASAASPGIVDVTVTSPGGTSTTSPGDQFTRVGAPTVSGLDPNSGPVSGGTTVLITGTNLTYVTGVNFGDMPAGFTVNDDSSITATSPFGEAVDTVVVTVVSIGGTSPVTPAARFAYVPPVCGDGTISAPEACDEGAANGTAASCCTSSCTFVDVGVPCAGGVCDGAGTCVPAGSSDCGNGFVEPGEECDDGGGNGQPGDCCTASCLFQPAGTACADDGELCTLDACDGAGSCIHPVAPAVTCMTPQSQGASLVMRVGSSGSDQQAQFKWGKGPAVGLDTFGDPGASNTLRLCVYEEAAADAYDLMFAASPSVAGGGVWTPNTTGWKFKSATGAPEGIASVVLKAAAVPLKAKVQVKAKASLLFPVGLPLPTGMGVVAQVKGSLGACWGATFSAPNVISTTEFKAKSD